jgi:ATP-dependent helicase/nuclease subunit A
MYAVAEAEYHKTLEAHAVLDFPQVLLSALALLRQMDEFARSRYRLESRYHHVLVDEFQDTSRAQWELISLLVQSWGEGAGLTHVGPLPPTIFIVGDRKQSIYSFRDADASIFHEAARHLEGLRPDGDVRRSISRSFRSVPSLLAFVNDLCRDVDKVPERPDTFRYDEEDCFPVDSAFERSDALGLVVAETPEGCAETTAAEIARLLREETTIRDRDTGIRRTVRPGDIAILFRTRESHRDYEEALERRGIPAYVYKGLGFFDADEIKDVLALLWYLADPASDLRAAAWLRSRFVHLSDEGLRRLAPRLADASRTPTQLDVASVLDERDRRAILCAREAAARWLSLVDRLPPAELLDRVLAESAYAAELAGPRFHQARENLKKMRALIRRIQNRGYATLTRIVEHLDRLAVGDEANAAIDATDSVNLMTVHASKGLEFPVVFVVNLARGTAGRRAAIRVAADPVTDNVSVAVGDFQSDADDDDAAREREETKRLLYVALTRARDRLYLGSALKDGRMQPGRGSLAEVLPPSLVELFAEAAASARLEWRSGAGAIHVFSVCAGAADTPADGRLTRDAVTAERDFGPVADASTPRSSVAEAILDDAPPGVRAERRAGAVSDRLLGTVVHRLLQRLGLGPERSGDGLVREIRRVLRPDEATDIGDRNAFENAVICAYDALRSRPDVRELYSSGQSLHEVPFTMRLGGAIVRGTIDCLVRSAGGHVTVLEFKTGRPRPEHQRQAELYRLAAESVFPGAAVDTRLVYVGEVNA